MSPCCSRAERKAVLVVSFGTSFADTRAKTLDAIEEHIRSEFPNHEIRRAYTSKTIMKKLRERDGICIDNPEAALQRLKEEGFAEVTVQPTHMINGIEYSEVVATCREFREHFESLKIGMPLLSSTDDFINVIRMVSNVLPECKAGEGILLMGHGTPHHANSVYPALDYMFKQQGHPHIYVATVDGYPDLDVALQLMEHQKYRKVTLVPFMIVAGDHARNDMAGDDEDSWKNQLETRGYAVDVIMAGLGELEPIQQMFADHARSAEPVK